MTDVINILIKVYAVSRFVTFNINTVGSKLYLNLVEYILIKHALYLRM
jgi:hypothetical protein